LKKLPHGSGRILCPVHGLVLTGGGARAAYQVGVLRGIAEIKKFDRFPFPIVTGVSAGAINGVALASWADDDFGVATEKLWALWERLHVNQVFKTDPVSLFGIGSRWIRDLSLGGFLGAQRASYLLDTEPLRELLEKTIRFDKIDAHLAQDRLHGLAVSATNYMSGTAVSFFDGHPSIETWQRSTRIALRERLTLDHVMASSAIPVFFPPVRVSGSFYGDGCIRLSAPISPAIHMGADRILAIGIRYYRPRALTVDLNRTVYDERISLVNVVGVLLNAVFLDSLESDHERMERINRAVLALSEEQRAAHPDKLRHIPVVVVKPSVDLGSLASEQFDRFPLALRHLLRGLGASVDSGWDLLSYLAFDAAYTRRLLELGRADALSMREELLRFFG
jgi:NTE family protein